MSEIKTIEYSQAVNEVRKASRQFAMLYFNFCKVLVEELGLEQAQKIIHKSIFGLAIDRTNQLRAKVQALGEEPNLENFDKFSDLARIGWVKELGRNHCPYAETWVTYYDKYPWFRQLAPLYCNIIDTTNIDNFTGTLSHKLTQNVLWGDENCEREYFFSEDVKKGNFTYDPDSNKK
jgi:hypothetical protein